MNRLFALLLAPLLLAPLLLAGGCSEEEDTRSAQQNRIVSYLQSTHSPRLVAFDQIAEGEERPYYTVSGNTVYRYISNVYDPDRPNWPEVTPASVVTITFRAYQFAYANIVTHGATVTMPYYTNDPLLRDAFLSMEGFNPELWHFEPLRIEMGSADILKGLRLALAGCRAGDEVEAYMTYNMAYGGDNFGIIPRETPIAIFFTVNSVE